VAEEVEPSEMAVTERKEEAGTEVVASNSENNNKVDDE